MESRLYIDGLSGNVNSSISLGPNRTLDFRSVYPAARRSELANLTTFLASEASPDFSSVARNVREAIMRGTVLQSGQTLDAASVWAAFYPAIILAGILVLIAGIFIPIAIYTCARIHPSLVKGFVERPKGFLKPGSFKRLVLPVIILFLALGFGVWSLLMIFYGNIMFTQNLNTVRDAGNDLFTLAGAKIVGVGPVANIMVTDLNETIRSALNSIANSVDAAKVAKGIEPTVDLLATDLSWAETSLSSVSAQSTAMSTASQQADAAYPPLRNIAATYVTNVNSALNEPNLFPTNNAARATYQLTPVLALPAPRSAISPQPPATGAAAALAGFVGDQAQGATAYLSQARDTLAEYNGETVANTITTAVNDSATAAQAILVPPIQQTLDDITRTYREQLLPLVDSIDSVARQFNEVVQFLLQIDLGRSIVTFILAAFGVFCFLVVLICMLTRSPRAVGHCLLASFTLGIISLLFAALYLSIGVVIGATCGALEGNNLNALIPTVNQIAGTSITPGMVNAVLLARSQCAAGIGGIQVAVEVVKALQTAGALSGDFDPATVDKIQDGITQIELFVNGTTSNQIDTAIEAAAAEIPNKVNQGLGFAQTAIQLALEATDAMLTNAVRPLVRAASTDPYSAGLRTATAEVASLGAAGGTAGRAASSNPARVAEAVALLQASAASLKSTWDSIDILEGAAVNTANAAVLASAEGADISLEQFKLAMQSFGGHAVDLANVTLRLVGAEAANFTQYGLPPIKSAMRSFGAGAKSMLESLAACKSIVEDTYVIQNAVCQGVSRASDQLWLGLLIQGFLWTVGTLLLFYAIKKVWNTDAGWRWFGRAAPMPAYDAERYELNGRQKLTNVEQPAIIGGDWSAFSSEAPKYSLSLSPMTGVSDRTIVQI